MPNPTAASVHVNRPLTNISVAYAATGNYIADRAFPAVPVPKQSDQYFVYDKGDWTRSEAQKRAPATESAGSGWTLTTDNYFADVFAIHKDIADQQLANQDNPINLDQDATRWVTRQILMKREKEWAAAFFAGGVWGTDLDGVSSAPGAGEFLQWDQSGSDPIGDITAENTTIMSQTGYMPNVGVCQAEVLQVLRNHPDVIDRIKYTQTGIVTNQLLAAVFDLDEFLVASAVENSANEGAADSMGFILDKAFLSVYAAPPKCGSSKSHSK